MTGWRRGPTPSTCPVRPRASGLAFDVKWQLAATLNGAARQQITNFAEQLNVSRNFGGGLFLFLLFQLVDPAYRHEQNESDDHEVYSCSQKLTVAKYCALLFRVSIGEARLHLCRQRHEVI